MLSFAQLSPACFLYIYILSCSSSHNWLSRFTWILGNSKGGWLTPCVGWIKLLWIAMYLKYCFNDYLQYMFFSVLQFYSNRISGSPVGLEYTTFGGHIDTHTHNLALYILMDGRMDIQNYFNWNLRITHLYFKICLGVWG